jgi:hypothetical protein
MTPLLPKPNSKSVVLLQALAALAALTAGTCFAETPLDRYYERTYPFYTEVCSYTQFKSKAGDVGGSAGHATMYIKGLCRDRKSPYPRLKACDAGQTPNGASGVDVSVNKMFKNVNWVAVEGRDMMFRAGLPEGEALTKANYQAVIQRLRVDQVVRGVEVSMDTMKGFAALQDPTMTLQEYIIRKSIGTDYGVTLARKAYCGKVVLTEGQSLKMMDYLNGLNDRYFRGPEKYNWSGVSDNCTHTINNAFWAAGFRRERKTSRPFLIQIFNLAIPSNEFVRAAQLANQKPISDALTVFRDQRLKKMFNEEGFLPGLEEGIVQVRPMLAEGNEIFDFSPTMTTMSIPILRPINSRIKTYTTRPEYTDEIANLQRRYELFKEAFENLVVGDAYAPGVITPEEADEFFDFQTRYNAYIREATRRLGEELDLAQQSQ